MKTYKQFITDKPCLACLVQDPPDETPLEKMVTWHHLSFPGKGGNIKIDEYTVPICFGCHAVLHTNEKKFWNELDVNPWQYVAFYQYEYPSLEGIRAN